MADELIATLDQQIEVTEKFLDRLREARRTALRIAKQNINPANYPQVRRPGPQPDLDQGDFCDLRNAKARRQQIQVAEGGYAEVHPADGDFEYDEARRLAANPDPYDPV